MIDIEHKYNDIVLITDNSYKKDRYSVYEHLFEEYTITVLDYAIKIREDNKIFEKWLDFECVGFKEDFIDVLKEFNPITEQEGLKDCNFELKVLCRMQ